MSQQQQQYQQQQNQNKQIEKQQQHFQQQWYAHVASANTNHQQNMNLFTNSSHFVDGNSSSGNVGGYSNRNAVYDLEMYANNAFGRTQQEHLQHHHQQQQQQHQYNQHQQQQQMQIQLQRQQQQQQSHIQQMQQQQHLRQQQQQRLSQPHHLIKIKSEPMDYDVEHQDTLQTNFEMPHQQRQIQTIQQRQMQHLSSFQQSQPSTHQQHFQTSQQHHQLQQQQRHSVSQIMQPHPSMSQPRMHQMPHQQQQLTQQQQQQRIQQQQHQQLQKSQVEQQEQQQQKLHQQSILQHQEQKSSIMMQQSQEQQQKKQISQQTEKQQQDKQKQMQQKELPEKQPEKRSVPPILQVEELIIKTEPPDESHYNKSPNIAVEKMLSGDPINPEKTQQHSIEIANVKHEKIDELPKDDALQNIQQKPQNFPRRKVVTTERSETLPICQRCKQVFLKKHSYTKHVAQSACEMLEYDFKCSICPMSFRSMEELQSHEQLHRSNNFFCHKYCGKFFESIELCEAHEYMNHDYATYVCNICSANYSTRELLFAHLPQHRNQMRYDCPVCRLWFQTTQELHQHRLASPMFCGKYFNAAKAAAAQVRSAFAAATATASSTNTTQSLKEQQSYKVKDCRIGVMEGASSSNFGAKFASSSPSPSPSTSSLSSSFNTQYSQKQSHRHQQRPSSSMSNDDSTIFQLPHTAPTTSNTFKTEIKVEPDLFNSDFSGLYNDYTNDSYASSHNSSYSNDYSDSNSMQTIQSTAVDDSDDAICCVPHCGVRKKTSPTIQFFGFPKEDKYLQQWLHNLKMFHIPPSEYMGYRICGMHFPKRCINRYALAHWAVPTFKLGHEEVANLYQNREVGSPYGSGEGARCSMPGCSSQRGECNLKFYNFPKEIKSLIKWCQNARLPVQSKEQRHFCSRHFEERCIGKFRLKPWAVPTLHLGTPYGKIHDNPKHVYIEEKRCCLQFCRRARSSDINMSLYRFPRDEVLLQRWCYNLRLDPNIYRGKNHKICSSHFIKEALGLRKLAPGAVPTLNLGHDDTFNIYENELYVPPPPPPPQQQQSKNASKLNMSALAYQQNYYDGDTMNSPFSGITSTPNLTEFMDVCCVTNCASKRHESENVTFHTMPRRPEQLQKWLHNLKLEPEKLHKGMRICSLHFEPFCIGGCMRPFAVPTLLLGHDDTDIYQNPSVIKKLNIRETCCVPTCKRNRDRHHANLHRFPPTPDMLQKWCENLHKVVPDGSKLFNDAICEIHFEDRCLRNKRLEKWAIPTMNLGHYDIMHQLPTDEEIAVYWAKPPAPNIGDEEGECCVETCRRNPQVDDVKLYRTPEDPEILAKWVHNLQIDADELTQLRICNLHFEAHCIGKRLYFWAIPTLNLGKNIENLYENPEVPPVKKEFKQKLPTELAKPWTPRCCLPHCRKQRSTDNVMLFRFPSLNRAMLAKWCHNTQMPMVGSQQRRLCSSHFEQHVLTKKCPMMNSVPTLDLNTPAGYKVYQNPSKLKAQKTNPQRICLIAACRKSREDGVTLFRFPHKTSTLRKWFHNLRQKPKGAQRALLRICSEHFEPHSVLNKRLSPHAVPTLNLGHEDNVEDLYPNEQRAFVDEQCVVSCCESMRDMPNIRLFKFPQDDEDQLWKWSNNLKMNPVDCHGARICNRHFEDDCMGPKNLYKWAIPTLYLGHDDADIELVQNPPPEERYTEVIFKCCVPTCGKTRKYDDAQMNSFPKNPKYFKRWKHNLKLDFLDFRRREYYKICNDHFEPICIGKMRLNYGAIPTLHLGHNDTTGLHKVRPELLQVNLFGKNFPLFKTKEMQLEQAELAAGEAMDDGDCDGDGDGEAEVNTSFDDTLEESTSIFGEEEDSILPDTHTDMTTKCIYPGCTASKTLLREPYDLPRAKTVFALWCDNMSLNASDVPTEAKLCGLHFMQVYEALLDDMTALDINLEPGIKQTLKSLKAAFERGSTSLLLQSAQCAVPDCSSTTLTPHKLFPFPYNRDLQAKWTHNTGIELDEHRRHLHKVCALHFESHCVTESNRLRPWAIPTLHLELAQPGTLYQNPDLNSMERRLIGPKTQKCCVSNCDAVDDASLRLFSFPTDEIMLSKWAHNLKLEREKCPLYKICLRHFERDCMGKERLRGWALPTLELGHNDTDIYELNQTKEQIDKQDLDLSNVKMKKSLDVAKCCINSCRKSRLQHGVRLFNFPSNSKVLKKWLHNLQMTPSMLKKCPQICNFHFNKRCIEGKQLRPWAIPTISLGHEESIYENPKNITGSLLTICSLSHCRKQRTVENDLCFYRYPKEPTLLAKWCKNLKLNYSNEHTGRVCEEHFDPEVRGKLKLIPGAVPTLNLGHEEPAKYDNKKLLASKSDDSTELNETDTELMDYEDPDNEEPDEEVSIKKLKLKVEPDEEVSIKKLKLKIEPDEEVSIKKLKLKVEEEKEVNNISAKHENKMTKEKEDEERNTLEISDDLTHQSAEGTVAEVQENSDETMQKTPQKTRVPNNVSPVCCLKHCGKQKTPTQHLSTFGFPKDSELLRKWSENLNLPFDQCQGRVCIEHFELQVVGARKLRPGAVPTLQLGYEGKPKHTNQMNEQNKETTTTNIIQEDAEPIAEDEVEVTNQDQQNYPNDSCPNLSTTNPHYAEKLSHSVFRLCCLKHCRKRNKREPEVSANSCDGEVPNQIDIKAVLDDDLSFRFPKEAELLQKWFDNLKLKDIKKLPNPRRLCSVHFEPKAISHGTLKPGVVPTLDLGEGIVPVHLNSEEILNFVNDDDIFSYCHVKNCTNAVKGRTTRLFKFPKSAEMQQIWCENLQLISEHIPRYRICYIHFESRCINHVKLFKWAVPTLEVGHLESLKHHNPPEVSESSFVSSQRCCLQSCRKTRQQNGVELYLFPSPSQLLARKWCHNTKIAIHQISQLRICSEHFVKSAMINGRIRSWALPTLNLGHTDDIYDNPTQNLEHCCVETCENTELNGLFSFPKRSGMLRKWALNTGQDAYHVHKLNLKVCRKHFDAICFNEQAELKPDALPTLHLNNDAIHQLELDEESDDYAHVVCSVPNCGRTMSSDGIKLYQFPKDADMLAKWANNLQIDLSNSTNKSICNMHFEPVAILKNRLHEQAIPTLFLGHTTNDDFTLYTGDYTQNTSSSATSTALANCCVKGCTKTRQIDGVHLYRFPKQRPLAMKWAYNLQLKLTTKQLNYFKVCEIHFESACRGNLHLEPGAIPTLHLGHNDDNIYRFNVKPSEKVQIMPPIKATTVASYKTTKNVPCAVPACAAANQLQLKFWSLPEDKELRVKWCELLELQSDAANDRTQLCALHFARAYELCAKEQDHTAALESVHEIYEPLVKSTRLQLFRCSVPVCDLSIIDGVKLTKLPSNPDMLQKWLHNTQIEYEEKRSYIYRVCTAHFEQRALGNARLHKWAVPTLNLPQVENIYENEAEPEAEEIEIQHGDSIEKTNETPENISDAMDSAKKTPEKHLVELELSKTNQCLDDISDESKIEDIDENLENNDSTVETPSIELELSTDNGCADNSNAKLIAEDCPLANSTILVTKEIFNKFRTCAVEGCLAANIAEMKFWPLPDDEILQKVWSDLLQIKSDEVENNMEKCQVCSLHFMHAYELTLKEFADLLLNLELNEIYDDLNKSTRIQLLRCSVPGCNLTIVDGINLKKLPKNLDLVRKWLQNTRINYEDKRRNIYRICSEHFENETELEEAVPTRNLPTDAPNDDEEEEDDGLDDSFNYADDDMEPDLNKDIDDNTEDYFENEFAESMRVTPTYTTTRKLRIQRRTPTSTPEPLLVTSLKYCKNQKCLVPNCTYASMLQLRCWGLPSDESLRERWCELLNLSNINAHTAQICALHFMRAYRLSSNDESNQTALEELSVIYEALNKSSRLQMFCCSVKNCSTSVIDGIRLIKMPTNAETVEKWMHNTGIIYDEKRRYLYRICTLHFEPYCFANTRLHKWAVPTLNLPVNKDIYENYIEGFDLQNTTMLVSKVSTTYISAHQVVIDHNKCCINRCDSGTGDVLFNFPKAPRLLERWLQNLCIPTKTNTAELKVCAKHFEPHTISGTKLLPYAVPTVALGHNKLILHKNPNQPSLDESVNYSTSLIVPRFKYCSVPGCGRSKFQDGVKLYKFPDAPETIGKWCHNIKLDLKSAQDGFICSVHFDENCFKSGRLLLRAVPTLHLGHSDDDIHRNTANQSSINMSKITTMDATSKPTTHEQVKRTCCYPMCTETNDLLLNVPNARELSNVWHKTESMAHSPKTIIEVLCTKHFKIVYEQCKEAFKRYQNSSETLMKSFDEYTNKIATGFCAVPECYTNIYSHERKLEFYAFPTDSMLKEKWSYNLKIDIDERVKNLNNICSLHFDPAVFVMNTTRLRRGAVPTLNLPNDSEHDSTNERKDGEHKERKCCIRNCINGEIDVFDTWSVRLFEFCKDPEHLKKWIHNTQIDEDKTKLSFVCALHFEPICFKTKELPNWALPTLLLGHERKDYFKLMANTEQVDLNDEVLSLQKNDIGNNSFDCDLNLEGFDASNNYAASLVNTSKDEDETQKLTEEEQNKALIENAPTKQIMPVEFKIKQEIFYDELEDEDQENANLSGNEEYNEFNNTQYNIPNNDNLRIQMDQEMTDNSLLHEIKIKEELFDDEPVEDVSTFESFKQPTLRFEITQVTSQTNAQNAESNAKVQNITGKNSIENHYFEKVKIKEELINAHNNDRNDLIVPTGTSSSSFVAHYDHEGSSATPTLEVQLEIDHVEEYNENYAYDEPSTFCEDDNNEYDYTETNPDFDVINQRRCQIMGCHSTKDTPDIILHKFPAPEPMLKKWEHNTQVRVDRQHHWRYRICSRHFEPTSYSGTRLMLGTLPTLYLGPNRPVQIYQNEYAKNAAPVVTPIITSTPSQMRAITKSTPTPNPVPTAIRPSNNLMPPLRTYKPPMLIKPAPIAKSSATIMPEPSVSPNYDNLNGVQNDSFPKPQYAVFNKSFNSRRCRIEGCTSHAEMPGVTLHKFPLPEDHFRKWVHNTNIQVDPACRWRYRICNLHFEPGCLRGVRFMPGTMPTLKLGPNRPSHIYPNEFMPGTSIIYSIYSKVKSEPVEKKFSLVPSPSLIKPKLVKKEKLPTYDYSRSSSIKPSSNKLGQCSVPGCTTVSEDDFVKLYEFPMKKRMFKKWLHNTQLKVNETNRSQYRICSLHFEDECFGDGLELHCGSVPKLYLGRNAARWKHINDFNEDPNQTDSETEESEDDQEVNNEKAKASEASTKSTQMSTSNSVHGTTVSSIVTHATHCSIVDCSTSLSTSTIPLHAFPKLPATYKKWIHNTQLQVDTRALHKYSVCKRHFTANCYRGNDLHPDAVPTLNLGPKSHSTLFLNAGLTNELSKIEKTTSSPDNTASINPLDDVNFTLNARCSIPTCHRERGIDGVSLHRLPQHEPLLRKWLKNCRLDLATLNNASHRPRICSIHFAKRCFVGIKQPNLQYGSIPTLHLGYDLPTDVDDGMGLPDDKELFNKVHTTAVLNTSDPSNGTLVEYEVTEEGEVITYNAIKSGYQKCSLIHCQKNLTIHGVKTYKFPKSPEQCEKWTHNLNIKYDPLRPWKYLICSDHFEKCCFVTTDTKTSLTRWAVPTLKLGNNIPKVLFTNEPWGAGSKQLTSTQPGSNAGKRKIETYDDDSIDDDQLLFEPTIFKRKRSQEDNESVEIESEAAPKQTEKDKISFVEAGTIDRECNKVTFRQSHCCLPHCYAERGPDSKLFRVPAEPDLLSKWEYNLNMIFKINERDMNRVCQRHFESNLIGTLRLMKSAIPTLNLGGNAPTNLYTNEHLANVQKTELDYYHEDDEDDLKKEGDALSEAEGVDTADDSEMIECAVEIGMGESNENSKDSDYDNQTFELSGTNYDDNDNDNDNDNANDNTDANENWRTNRFYKQNNQKNSQFNSEPRKLMYKQCHCCLPHCGQKRTGSIKLFRIPKNPMLLSKWEHNLRFRFKLIERNISLVCSAHFEAHVIGAMRLLRGAIPTLNLGNNNTNIYRHTELDYLKVPNMLMQKTKVEKTDASFEKSFTSAKLAKTSISSTSILQTALNLPVGGLRVKNSTLLEPICCLSYCGRRGSKDGVTFFKFPQGELFKSWCEILEINEQQYRNSELKICSAHFTPNSYSGAYLKPFAKPSLNLGTTTTRHAANTSAKCIASNCTTTSSMQKLYPFPENRNLCAKWCHNLKVEQKTKLQKSSDYRLCRKHFEDNCMLNDKLHPEAVPTLSLGHKDPNIFSNAGSFETSTTMVSDAAASDIEKTILATAQQQLGNLESPKAQLNQFYADYKMARQMLPSSTVLSIANNTNTKINILSYKDKDDINKHDEDDVDDEYEYDDDEVDDDDDFNDDNQNAAHPVETIIVGNTANDNEEDDDDKLLLEF